MQVMYIKEDVKVLHVVTSMDLVKVKQSNLPTSMIHCTGTALEETVDVVESMRSGTIKIAKAAWQQKRRLAAIMQMPRYM